MAQLLGDYRDRLLQPVASLSASKLLLQKQIPDSLPSNLGNACRSLARQVLEILEIGDAEADRHTAQPTAAIPAAALPQGYASAARH